MSTLAQIFAGIAAALHVLFFYLESVVFTKNGTFKTFGLATPEEAEIVKPMALNQGFYNLFLAIGIVVGIVLHNDAGEAIVAFALACMLGAAVVLLISTRARLLRGVLIQGTAPLIGLILIVAG